METKAQIRVIKADGTVEQYMHTKVIGTIANALSRTGQAEVMLAEHLAEAVTYYIYKKQSSGGGRKAISSYEVFSIIKAVLSSTGYEEVACLLQEHHFERRLKRGRVEVVPMDVCEFSDAEKFYNSGQSHTRQRWDKSCIVENLMNKHNVDRQTARMIASMVEEKIFAMGISVVPVSLIKQLVWGDAGRIMHAQRQLAEI